MIQFYFLSIVFNVIAGYALTIEDDSRGSVLDGLKSYVLDETFRLVAGVMTMAVGFFKLLSVVRGDIPVIGDLVPALAGMVAGFTLIFEFYRVRSTLEGRNSEKFERIFVKNRKFIGYITMASAGAHFLFPTVLFL